MGKLPVDVPYIIHGGSTEGYKPMAINLNGGEWTITLLANIGDQTNLMDLATKITTILYEGKDEH